MTVTGSAMLSNVGGGTAVSSDYVLGFGASNAIKLIGNYAGGSSTYFKIQTFNGAYQDRFAVDTSGNVSLNPTAGTVSVGGLKVKLSMMTV